MLKLKTLPYITYYLLMILFFSFISSFVVSASNIKQENNITIVFSADMPAMLNKLQGDYRNLAYLVKKQRQKEVPSFFIFGGGSIGPSPMSSFDKGSHIIDILNTIEPDAMAVTKREFIYFEDELSMRAYEAGFPIFSTNLIDKNTSTPLDGLVSHVVIERKGKKIAVFGLINESVIEEYLLKRVEVLNPIEAITTELKRVAPKEPDLTLLIVSYYDQRIQKIINSHVIDLIIITDTSLSEKNIRSLRRDKNVVLYNEPHTGLVINTNGKDHYVDYISLSNLPADNAIGQQIEEYATRLNRLLDTELGIFESRVNTTRRSVRSEENAFGNLLADAMRLFTGSDIALINGGVIRGNNVYNPGTPVTRGLIATELPFRSRVVMIKVTGKQILEALNNGVSKINELKGRFPHVSGLKYEINKLGDEFRVESVYINGQPLGMNEEYTIATSDYIAAGGDGYTMFKGKKNMSIGVRLTPLLSEVLISYIQEREVINVSKDGRISFD